MKTTQAIKDRLDYLRSEIENKSISQGEILELESLAEHIEPGDVQLLEWAGVDEDTNKPLVCTHDNCNALQTADGEFCDEHGK